MHLDDLRTRILCLDGDLASSRGFFRVCLLLLLDECPGYGYDLSVRVGTAGLANVRTAKVYRALWQLEEARLVSQTWETGGGGPPRRVYCLTRAGRRTLASLAPLLRQRVTELDDQVLAPFVQDRLSVIGRPVRRDRSGRGRDES